MNVEWEIKEIFPTDDGRKGYEIEVDCFWISAYSNPGERPEEVISRLREELEAVIKKYRI